MKMVVRYFKQHSRSTMIRFAIITFICLVVITLVTQGVIDDYDRMLNYQEKKEGGGSPTWTISPQLPFLVVIAVVMTTILPMIELSAFNSRKYLDSAFSFPISRTAMVSVNLLNGFIQFLLAYTVSFIWYVIRLGYCADKLNFLPIWEFFFMSLLYSLFIYCFNAFFFSLCNSSADGAIVALTWQFVLCPLALTLTEMFGIKWYKQYLFIVWMPLGWISDHCDRLAEGYASTPDFGTNNPNAMLISLICAVILAVALCAGTIFFFSRKRAESAGEISDTPVGYKVLIPVCAGMLLYWALEADASFISLMALIFSTVAYIIYRRGVRVKVLDLVVIGTCFACFLMGVMA